MCLKTVFSCSITPTRTNATSNGTQLVSSFKGCKANLSLNSFLKFPYKATMISSD